jgi:hypothetical protein
MYGASVKAHLVFRLSSAGPKIDTVSGYAEIETNRVLGGSVMMMLDSIMGVWIIASVISASPEVQNAEIKKNPR